VADRTKELNRSKEKLAILLRENMTRGRRKGSGSRGSCDDTSQSLNAILIALDSIVINSRSTTRPESDETDPEQCMTMLKGSTG
jgi:hypothetical protein